jgi:hypothetical protein
VACRVYTGVVPLSNVASNGVSNEASPSVGNGNGDGRDTRIPTDNGLKPIVTETDAQFFWNPKTPKEFNFVTSNKRSAVRGKAQPSQTELRRTSTVG